MEENQVIEALKSIKDNNKKRKFTQTYDLILNLKDIDTKKQDNQMDIFITLPYLTGKKIKICALVGPELYEDAKKHADKVIHSDEFKNTDKKQMKKIAEEHDYFIAQADIMQKVAQNFGRILGPKGKMPNPKAGCVVPPKANMENSIEKLLRTICVSNKKEPVMKARVGTEDMDEKKIVENIMNVYNTVVPQLPLEKNNIHNILLKLTMGKPQQLA